MTPALKGSAVCTSATGSAWVGMTWRETERYVGRFRAALARERLEKQEGVAQIYFAGCGGDVTVGKYNDGSPANRPALAGRLAKGMKEAFASIKRVPVKASDVEWRATSR